MLQDPRGWTGLRPSVPAPSYHRLPFFLASPCLIFDRISKIHIFGTKLQSCLETYFIRCGLEIDRDLNAAINIQAVGVDAAIRTQSSRVAGCVEASKME